jgi:hypothetical protein
MHIVRSSGQPILRSPLYSPPSQGVVSSNLGLTFFPSRSYKKCRLPPCERFNKLFHLTTQHTPTSALHSCDLWGLSLVVAFEYTSNPSHDVVHFYAIFDVFIRKEYSKRLVKGAVVFLRHNARYPYVSFEFSGLLACFLRGSIKSTSNTLSMQ